MRANKKRDFHAVPALQRPAKQEVVAEPRGRRRRLPVPVICTGRPATLDLTNQKIDEILFG